MVTYGKQVRRKLLRTKQGIQTVVTFKARYANEDKDKRIETVFRGGVYGSTTRQLFMVSRGDDEAKVEREAMNEVLRVSAAVGRT